MTSVGAGRLAGQVRASREPLPRGQRLVLTMMAAVLIMQAMVLVGGILAWRILSGQLHDVHEQLVDLRAGLREGIGDIGAEASDRRDPAGP